MTGYGEKLKQLRKQKNLTQEDVAKDNGLSSSAYTKYEQEARIPRDDVKKKLALYFATSVQDIFF